MEGVFLNPKSARSDTEHPNGLHSTLFKHSLSEWRDCFIEWAVDFGKMEIQLHASFISPALITECLWHMSRHDARFRLTSISNPLQMNRRFNISLCVDHGDCEVRYKLMVYNFMSATELIVWKSSFPEYQTSGKGRGRSLLQDHTPQAARADISNGLDEYSASHCYCQPSPYP
jgi:hypothetical protein